MLRLVRGGGFGGRSAIKRNFSSLEEDYCEQGSGTPKDPFLLPLRKTANESGCFHCCANRCDCTWVAERLAECYALLPVTRKVQHPRRREFCAKSVLPPFVSRMVRVANISSKDTFYDLGCGNGSVLFQVALTTGARCVGVEISEQNATVAKEAWGRLRPVFEARSGRTLNVEIICADFCTVLNRADFFSPSPVVWVANLLMPRSVNHFLSERFRSLPAGSRVLCFEDLYPHARSVAALRDPDAFEKFHMADFKWQEMSVEWCGVEGPFFMYTKRE